MKFSNSSIRPIAQFCRNPDCFASFGMIETVFDIDIDIAIDVGLVFAGVKELVKRPSYHVLIAVPLGSVDMGEAGIESGEDLSGYILTDVGRTCTRCEIGNTTSVVENGRGRHRYQARFKVCSEIFGGC